jgi:site-specific DNA-methyltransferase (adenine-specific)
LAIAQIEFRLKKAFGIIPKVHGTPTDIEGARELALRDKYQFQNWIVAKAGGQPHREGKKGMDRGIDGYLYFRDDAKKIQAAIISVKGGATTPAMVRDLAGTVK